MSQAMFLKRVISRFQKGHPASEGWMVFEKMPDDKGLNVLPIFFKLKHPGAIAQMDLVSLLVWIEGGGPRRISLQDGTILKRNRGFGDIEWAGAIQFAWEGDIIEPRFRSCGIFLASPADRAAGPSSAAGAMGAKQSPTGVAGNSAFFCTPVFQCKASSSAEFGMNASAPGFRLNVFMKRRMFCWPARTGRRWRAYFWP